MRNEYYEVQRFRQIWLWVIIIGSTLTLCFINARMLHQQLVLDKPVGDKPMSDGGLLLYAIFSTVFLVLLIVMFIKSRLEIKVDRFGVSYRYYPFIRNWRFIGKQEIKQWDVKKYFVLGYGLRFGLKFLTINIAGNTGLELVLFERRNIRLGTQRPDELRAAMQNLFNSPQE